MAANWDNLQERLGKDLFDKVRHSSGRKLEDFDEARQTVTLLASEAAQLDVTEVEDIWDDLPDKYADSIFIAAVGERRFLVNTEGFSYCRYVAKLRVVEG